MNEIQMNYKMNAKGMQMECKWIRNEYKRNANEIQWGIQRNKRNNARNINKIQVIDKMDANYIQI